MEPWPEELNLKTNNFSGKVEAGIVGNEKI